MASQSYSDGNPGSFQLPASTNNTLMTILIRVPLGAGEETMARPRSKSLQVTLSRRQRMSPGWGILGHHRTTPDCSHLVTLHQAILCPWIYPQLWKEEEAVFPVCSPLALRVWREWLEDSFLTGLPVPFY